MFWYGLTCLVLWMLLVMAAFALGRLSARGGRRPHSYQGYQAPTSYDQPGSPAGDGPVTAAQILAERFARGGIGEHEFWAGMTTLSGRTNKPRLLKITRLDGQAAAGQVAGSAT